MPERFYFDIVSGDESIRDEDGVEAPSLEEALDEARGVIREMADELAAADPGESWTMIVRDASGALVARLPIKA